jgi:hypothetical protein
LLTVPSSLPELLQRVFTITPEYAIIQRVGDVAQLGERDNRTVEVRGSSPLISTSHNVPFNLCLANRKQVWYSKYQQEMRDEQE